MKKRLLGVLVFFLAIRAWIEAQSSSPTVQFSSANYSAVEGAGVANLTITKMGATNMPVTAYYKTRDGTATAPSDYTFTGDDLTASVTFQPGETRKSIQIALKNDGYREPDETFQVFFTVVSNATVGMPDTATVTIIDDDPQGPEPPARALNISTRAKVQTGDRALIAGFIITGNNSKAVVVRALGPSLAQAGIPSAQVLLDPVLQLRGADGTLIMQSDDWKDSPSQRFYIEGSIYQPKDDREAAMILPLSPGAYTASVTGKGQTTGIGLVEVYDYNPTTDSELANISTRGDVGSGNNVMIGGFTLGHEPATVQVALRGLGPSLTNSGLTNCLPDPVLELHTSNGSILASNDDWQSDSTSAGQLSAHGLALPNAKESGLFVLLPPGQFTAILTGKNGGTGIGLIEVYNLK
ncbi:MAG: hypothetical protein DME97_11325 [Verrucomicrobia bacterium]|nr:MAG: hypothetical protein DME97_11325 [Verrucomicrobiota bacterium]